MSDQRIAAVPDIHGHAKGEHKPYAEERPIPYSARMLFLWFYHAAKRGAPRFLMVADHMNYLTFEDPAAVNLVRRALKLAAAGDLYGAAETAGVEVVHAAVVSEGLRRGMRYSIGAEVDNDPRSRPDAQNIVDAMRPDGMIRSVHFLTIEHPDHGAGWQWNFDNPEFASLFEHVGTERVWELYIAAVLEAVEKLPGHILGHFYVPAKFGHWPDRATLERYEDRVLAAVAERGMAIELNTRFLYGDHPAEQKERYRAANLRLLKKARAKGVGVAVGSDAHSPKDQGGCFDQIMTLLDQAEINELVFPIGGRLARVALRATKELLEQQAAIAETVLPGSSISGFGRAELASMNGGDFEEAPPPVRSARAAAAAARSTARVAETKKIAEKAAKVAKTVAAAAKAVKAVKALKSVVATVGATAPAKKRAAKAPPKRAASAASAKKRPALATSKRPAATKKRAAAASGKRAPAPARKSASAKPAKRKPLAKRAPPRKKAVAKKAASRKPSAPVRAKAKKAAKPVAGRKSRSAPKRALKPAVRKKAGKAAKKKNSKRSR